MRRSILITGATGKFGKAYSKHFLSNGDEVIALSRNKEKLMLMKSEFKEFEDNFKIIVFDLMEDNIEIDFIRILNELEISPTCLVNNARSIHNLKQSDDGAVNELSFINEYKLGVFIPYQLTMSLIKQSRNNLKKVVNISSIYGLVAPNTNLYNSSGQISPVHYGVTKAALIQLTKDLAVRLAKKDIQINCIAYGGVKGRVDKEFEERYGNLCPSGTMLSEDDLSGPLDFLLSDNSKEINGHVLVVDGGWTIW